MTQRAHTGTRHKPIRTCVGCRARDEQANLLRVGIRAGRPTLDPRRLLSGRGAYVHLRAPCVERAARRGGLARGLRRSIDRRDADRVVEAVQELTRTKSHVQ